jgi:hypothetical protein
MTRQALGTCSRPRGGRRADAADAHHFAGDVDETELLEWMAPVRLQRLLVLLHQFTRSTDGYVAS